MKTRTFSLIIVAGILWLSMLACSTLPFAKPLPTYTPQATYLPQPTYTPNPTLTPLAPADVPSSSDANPVYINNVDVVNELVQKGFTYAGDTKYGGCTSTCFVYENNDVGLSIDIYADGSLIITEEVASSYDPSLQEATTMLFLDKVYGQDLVMWIMNNVVAAKNGSDESGYAGDHGISMTLYNNNLLYIAISK